MTNSKNPTKQHAEKSERFAAFIANASKFLLVLVLSLFAIGCAKGQEGPPIDDPPPQVENPPCIACPPPPVTPPPSTQPPVNPYFNKTMVGDTWHFQDDAAATHDMWINIQSVPCAFGICDSNLVVWHYTKNDCFGYWNPRTVTQCAASIALDELWFVLHQAQDGRWYCVGFNYIDFQGTHWKVQILPAAPGVEIPYTIVPSGPNAPALPTSYTAIVQQNFGGDIANDFSPPVGGTFSTTWLTSTGLESYTSTFTGTISALISDQTEGCVHEHWLFEQNVGLVKVTPIVGLGDAPAPGQPYACINIEPSLIMHRVSP